MSSNIQMSLNSGRRALFISHAAPEDNQFSRWLSLQLIGLGYDVWCDVLMLKGGEDFWSDIEKELRTNTIKFLYVLTKTSNQREGTLKELAVAQKVKKSLEDTQFIIPIHLDHSLSYDDVNIELNRLNSIDFKMSWADGLSKLLGLLGDMGVPKSIPNFDSVNQLWRRIYLQDKAPIPKEEVYSSNWFPITEMPSELRFHCFGNAVPKDFDLRKLPYPAIRYGIYLATFAYCYDFMESLPKTDTYSASKTITVPMEKILDGSYHTEFVESREAKRILVQLLNEAFNRCLSARPVSVYEMSGKISFWIEAGLLEKDKYNKVQLVGKQKEKNWHFGISGSLRLFPEKCFVIMPHIWFTTNGHDLIPEASKQHSARRKQGKNWWNNDWRNKTLAFMQFVGSEDQCLFLALGSQECAKVSCVPLMFRSPVSYIDPGAENLPEEDMQLEEDEEIDQKTHAEDE